MAEAKKSAPKKSVPTPAADKRKAADDALEARIAARKAAKTVEPTTITEGELPFVPNVEQPKAEKPVKEKKERKAREAKPKAEAPAANVSDLVAKIEAKVSAKIEKVHSAQAKAVAKAHAAEVKQLKAEHKAALRTLTATLTSDNKSYVEEREKKAYAAGLKAGEKAATKSITAALKGR